MTENTKKDPKKIILIILAAVVVALVAVAVLLFLKNKEQQVEISEITEQMAFEKEMLEDEFQDFASQFDGYQIPEIHNDSLVELLVKEKQRVQDLLEELRITKATDARRIAQLKKELATVRAVMVTYVQQIDSLDRTNKQLVEENKQVKQQYHVVSREAAQLKQERTELSEKVTRAQMLDMSHFAFTPLNKRDRKAKAFAQIMKLQFDYTIAKNVTTEPGMKTIYLRITRPDGDVMQKSSGNIFPFENKNIAYSISKSFEYSGEAVSGTMYWTVEEILQEGSYTADFFVDGNLIGSYPFTMK